MSAPPASRRLARAPGPAARRAPGPAARRAPAPRRLPLAWLAAGFLLGVAASHRVSLWVHPGEAPGREPAPAPAPVAAAPERPAPKPLKFEFYDLLPGDAPGDGPAPAPVVAVAPVAASATDPAPAPPAGGPFWLQLGAFRAGAGAERLRAEATSLGLPARIEASGEGPGALHRVLAGPYASRGALAAHRRVLVAQGMGSVVTER